MSSTIKNLLLFKAGWLSCVIGAAQGLPWFGAVAVFAIALEHLRTANDSGQELRLLVLAASMGLVWESALVALNLVDYGDGLPLAPYWIIAMWVLFATTLNVGMNWLKKHWFIAFVAGAIGGPLSFISGEKMGAVTLTQDLNSVAAIGVGWAILLPVLVQAAKRFNGHLTEVPLSAQRA